MRSFFNIEALASMCYAANREWNRANGDAIPCDWPQASDDVRLGYHHMVILFSEGATEEDVHVAFLQHKLATGWKPGSFSAESKTHPYLIPYSGLTLRLRLKYLMYRKMVRVFIENVE